MYHNGNGHPEFDDEFARGECRGHGPHGWQMGPGFPAGPYWMSGPYWIFGPGFPGGPGFHHGGLHSCEERGPRGFEGRSPDCCEGRGPEGGHPHQAPHKDLVGSERYADMNADGKLFAMFRELEHLSRAYFGEKGGQGLILHVLSREGEMCQRELTERLGVQPASASETLGKLERAGLISRAPGAGERRGTVVTLTEEGKAKSAALDAEREGRMAEMFAPLNDDEKQQLLALTQKLYGAWKNRRAED